MWMGVVRFIADWGVLVPAGYSLASKLQPDFCLLGGVFVCWTGCLLAGELRLVIELLAIGFVNLYRRKTITAHNLLAALDAIRQAQYPPAAIAQMHFW
jgi:hypothetical protein